MAKDKNSKALEEAKASKEVQPEYDYVVAKAFRDKNNPSSTYRIGDSANRLGDERKEELASLGYLERKAKA